MIEFEYSIAGSPGGSVEVRVRIEAKHHGASYNKPLALALLEMLNDVHFQAEIRNAGLCRNSIASTEVFFQRPPNETTTYIWARFYLPEADPEEIQNIARQAQEYLSSRMTEAVDVFSMVQAVATVDPYKARMRQPQQREDGA